MRVRSRTMSRPPANASGAQDSRPFNTCAWAKSVYFCGRASMSRRRPESFMARINPLARINEPSPNCWPEPLAQATLPSSVRQTNLPSARTP